MKHRARLAASEPFGLLPMADLAFASIEALDASLESLARLRASTDLRSIPRTGPRMKGPAGRRLTVRVASRRVHRKSRKGSCLACSKHRPARPAPREREH